jgi:hypothetical protein
LKQNDDAYWTLLGQLAKELSERTEAAGRDRIALRDAVCEFVGAEHAKGTPLASVIHTVKRILREAEYKTTIDNTTEELATQLIDWCREFHRAAPALKS